MNKKFKNAMLLVGPTTSGKTEVAAAILNRYAGELINADKIYLFKGVRIGSGIMDTYNQIRAPLHFFEILEITDSVWSVDYYLKKVESCAANILKNGKLPLIEGCSAEYNIGLIRSNQVMKRDFRYMPVIGLKWHSNTGLRKKVRKRVDDMFDCGLIEEGLNIFQAGFRFSYPVRRSVVYSPLMEYLGGLLNFKETKGKIVQGIIDLAMKEYNILKSQDGIVWITHEENSVEKTIDEVDSYIKKHCF